MASSLFPAAPAGPHHSANQGTSAISFNAGKCAVQPQAGGKFLVTPEKRRGQVAFVKGRDGLHKFQWRDRTTGVVDFERIVFPQCATFKKVKTGREGDRVYLFDLEGQRTFFWLQDKDASQDEENVKKLSGYLNDPSTIPASGIGAGAGQIGRAGSLPAGAAPPVLDINSILGQLQFGNINAGQFQAPTTVPTAPVTRASSSSAPLTMEDLQRAMMGQPVNSSTAAAAAPRPPLQDIVTAEEIVSSGILEDPEVRTRLVEHLPPGQQSEEFLEENIRSAQFRQSMGALDQALVENFNGVSANIGINPAPGHDELVRGDTTGAFLTSVQAATPAVVPTPAATETSEATAAAPAATPSNPENGDGADQPTMEE